MAKIIPLMLFLASCGMAIALNCSNIDPSKPANIISPNSQLACYIEGCESNGTAYIWNANGPAGSLSYAFVPIRPYLNIKGWDNALQPGYEYWVNATCTEGSAIWNFNVEMGNRACLRDPWNYLAICTPTLNDFGLVINWFYQNINLILVIAIFTPIAIMALNQ